MPWFRVDDKLHDHRKSRVARKAAIGVWTLAGSWSMDNLTDGFIPADVLPRWGTRADAAALVKAGLWHPAEKDGETGWQFHDWHEFQPSAEKIIEEREQARARMKRIRSGGSSGDVRPNNPRSSVTSSPSPSPIPLSVVTSSSQSSSVLDELTDDDWQKIETATRGNRAHARKVAADVLSKAAGEVSQPRRYILRAVKNEPELYRATRGNPTRAQECPEHAGEWADNCRQHALERRLGGSA